MRRIVTILTGRHSVLLLLASLLILDLVLVTARFIPAVGKFLAASNNLFPILVITSLIQIILLLSVRILQENPLAITEDGLAREKVRELIERDRGIHSVQVLSAGLRSRADFLRGLLEHPAGLEIRVVTCFSNANPDELDRETFGPTDFAILTNRLTVEEASRLQVYQSQNTPSVRCILLSTQNGPRYAFLGWYTYERRNHHVQGRKNIQIFVDSTTQFGSEMLIFADRTFRRYADPAESELIWPIPITPPTMR